MQKKHYVYCNYNDTSMASINSNMALLRIRNHSMIIYNKVLDNRARLAHHPFTYKITCFHQVFDEILYYMIYIYTYYIYYLVEKTIFKSMLVRLRKRRLEVTYKIAFWKTLQNSQENTCTGVSSQ